VRLAAAAAVAAAVLAAGCGSGGKKVSLPAGASKTPGDAVAFVSLDTSSSDWKQATTLAARFPGLAPQLGRLERYRRAVGSEVDYALLDFGSGSHGALLTKPKDLARLKTLLQPDSTSYASLGGGWIAMGDYADTFKHRAQGSRLDGDKSFEETFGKLDKSAALRFWVRGSSVQDVLDRALAHGGAAPRLTHDAGDLKAIAGAGHAEANGARIDVHGTIDPAPDAATFKPSLPDSTPGGAVLYVSSTNLAAPARLILRMVVDSKPTFETQLKGVEGVFGITLENDVYPLLKGESALAVYPGGRIPPILFEQKVSDEAKADSLLRRFGAIAQASGQVDVRTIQLGGTTAQQLGFKSAKVTIYDGVAKSRIFVTNDESLARETIAGPAKTLADDAHFRAARTAAKLPGSVSAFAYADLAGGLPFLFKLAGQTGSTVGTSERANTKPLQNALVYLVKDGNDLKLSGFTTIK
jgi:Protein of unknown function (DUF3352)